MVILGINSVFHDTTACLVQDGQLLVAIEEERLTRQKHTSQFPYRAITECLAHAGMTLDDVDHVAISFKPTLSLFRKISFAFKHPLCFKAITSLNLTRIFWKYRDVRRWYDRAFKSDKKPPLHFIPHHESHAIGSFLICPYEKAALLSLDGSGEWATGFLGEGNGTEIKEFTHLYFPNSLGSLYEAVTYFLGFKPGCDEGKTMGLAPYGDATVYGDVVSGIVSVDDEAQLSIDLSYFRFQECRHVYLSQKFIQVFGQPRHPSQEIEQRHMDIAAAFQKILEECGLKFCEYLRRHSDADYLVIAGGVALNSVMNGRLVRESGFKDVYVMPAAGDNGTALGAAYCVYNRILKQPRNFVHRNPYIGKRYSDNEILSYLNASKLKYKCVEGIESEVASLIHQGSIIGWMQGATEIGPRALGNRSILADPTQPHMKDKINAEVKHRESFRPFAPSVPVEHLKTYFDIDVEVPFMLKVCDVREEKRSDLPAITHVDGSARVQSVNKELNPKYHKLINEFGKLSGVPVLLNTSFNIMGEPVVETPLDAIKCFFSTGLDYLVIGDYLISK